MMQKAGVFRGILFVIAGLILVFQPWINGLKILGWLILVPGALVLVGLLVRSRRAKRMQKSVVAEFFSGDCVYETGFLAKGMLCDLSVPGAGINGMTYDAAKGELSIYYSFLSRRGGREGDVAVLSVAPEEADRAQSVLAHFNLPTVEEAKTREAEKTEQVKNEKKG